MLKVKTLYHKLWPDKFPVESWFQILVSLLLLNLVLVPYYQRIVIQFAFITTMLRVNLWFFCRNHMVYNRERQTMR